MTEPLIFLDAEEIKKNIYDQKISITVLKQVSSTNEYLSELRDDASVAQFCLAEEQTKGKGRMGRSWLSPFGQNIYMSCRYILQAKELEGLSLVVGLAVLKALDLKGAYLKWPNDIVFDGKKLVGILLELQSNIELQNGICVSAVIIGVGINVNMLEDTSHRIEQEWISLQKISGINYNRNLIASNVINHLLSYLSKFNNEGFSGFINEWEEVDYLRDKKITVRSGEQKITGIAKGVNLMGQLILKTSDSNIIFSAGDVSICKNEIITA